ncbi:uncharacterized protein METZ01_LOCUS218956, partial [marine metagenome]
VTILGMPALGHNTTDTYYSTLFH